jgi:hypothetical protein
MLKSKLPPFATVHILSLHTYMMGHFLRSKLNSLKIGTTENSLLSESDLLDD